jgi:hypothetical protein
MACITMGFEKKSRQGLSYKPYIKLSCALFLWGFEAKNKKHFNYFSLINIGSGEIQNSLKQKIGLESSRAVDFTLRFVLLINFKFKIHTFNNHYESQCKINDTLNPLFSSK